MELLTTLETLDLYDNQLYSIPEEIKKLPMLKEITFDNNPGDFKMFWWNRYDLLGYV